MDWKWQYILNVYKCYDCNTEYTSEHENHMYLILWWPDITIYVNVLHWTICLQIISNVIFGLKLVFFNEMWHFENIPYANCNVRKTYWHNFLVPCFQYCTDKSYGTQVILPFDTVFDYNILLLGAEYLSVWLSYIWNYLL